MNATLPSGNRCYRGGDPRRQSGSTGVVPSALGLVYRVENPSRRGTPPGGNPAARRGRDGWVSGLDRVGALAVLSLRGGDRQPHLLAEGPTDEPAHGVRLPAGRLHDLLQGGSARAFHQAEDRLGLAALANAFLLANFLRTGGLEGRFGRLLCGLGLRGRLGLLGRNVRALRANT